MATAHYERYRKFKKSERYDVILQAMCARDFSSMETCGTMMMHGVPFSFSRKDVHDAYAEEGYISLMPVFNIWLRTQGCGAWVCGGEITSTGCSRIRRYTPVQVREY